MRLKMFVIVCLCLWLSKSISAQTPYIKAINYPYQINTRTIYDLYSDTQGQIWLGTDYGLFRFNGKQTHAIPFEESRQADFTHLKKDAQGRIWGMNFANQLAYLSNDTLRLFHFPRELQLQGNLIDFDFTAECIWLCTDVMVVAVHLQSNKVLYKYEEYKAQFYHIKAFKNKIHILKAGEDMVCDEQGSMKIIPMYLKNVGRFTVKGDELLAIHRENFSRKACKFKGKVWEEVPDFYIPDSEVIYHSSTSSDNKTWICTNQGGWLWDSNTGETRNLFPRMQVSDVIQDYQGNYWISTLNNGLWFCPSLKSLVFVPIDELKKNNTLITDIEASTNTDKYWVSSGNGRSYYTKLGGIPDFYLEGDFKKEISHLTHNPRQNEIINTSGVFNTSTKAYTPLPAPKDFRLYRQHYLLNARAFRAEWLIPFGSTKPPPKKLFGIRLNSSNNLLFGYPTYLIRAQRSYSVCIDSIHQKYWVGYADDLYEYDFEGKSKIIRTPEGTPITARNMCIDKHGRLYVATFNQGLLIIKNQAIIQKIGKSNLLKSNRIRKVINQNDTIWIGTNEEIGYFSPNQRRFVDVLGSHSIGKITYQDFIPTPKALLIASGFEVLYLPRQNSKKTSRLEIRKPQFYQKYSNVQIILEMLNYTNPEYSRFYYRLVGIDKKWQSIDDIQASLRYSQLYAGSYTLEYYASDEFSRVRSNVLKLEFEVPKQWWQKGWFYALSIMSILLLLVLIFYTWLRKAQARQSFREQIWVSQLKAIKAQMNPHFLYNILNTVQGLVYSNRRSEAAELLGRFSDLMRNVLESSEIPYLPLQDEINTIELYLQLEKSRFEGQDFKYSIEYQEVKDLLEYEIPSMLIQPFVENALKHGLLHKKNKKRVAVHFYKKNNALAISIEDNGIGREHAAKIKQRQAHRVTQFTMNATQQRIDLLNKMGKFKINFHITDLNNHPQTQQTGTRVELLIGFLKHSHV